jgi:hypothetical protein
MFDQHSKHQLLKDAYMELDKFVHDIYVMYDHLLRHTLKRKKVINKI